MQWSGGDLYYEFQLELKLSACMLCNACSLILHWKCEGIGHCVRSSGNVWEKRWKLPLLKYSILCVFAGYVKWCFTALYGETAWYEEIYEHWQWSASGPENFCCQCNFPWPLSEDWEYSRGSGEVWCETLFSCKDYPVGMIYLLLCNFYYVCEISLKNPGRSRKSHTPAWNWQWRMSLSSRLSNSTDYSRTSRSPASIKRKVEENVQKNIGCSYCSLQPWGWMVHNPASDRPVTDALTTTWVFHCHAGLPGLEQQQEYLDTWGIPKHTVKHYLTDIFNKLHVKRMN